MEKEMGEAEKIDAIGVVRETGTRQDVISSQNCLDGNIRNNTKRLSA
jgi:hypothetical protein